MDAKTGWKPGPIFARGFLDALIPGDVGRHAVRWLFECVHLLCDERLDGRGQVESDLTGRSFSSPAVAGGVVYYGDATGEGMGGRLYALDALTGKQLWSFDVPAGVFSSPVVLNGVVYFTSTDGSLYALR